MGMGMGFQGSYLLKAGGFLAKIKGFRKAGGTLEFRRQNYM